MHVLVNGWFVNQPYTGSGQYVRNLLRQLQQVWPGGVSVVIPGNEETGRPEGFDGCRFFVAKPPLPGALGKVFFEYEAISKAADNLKPDVIHIPYFGPPLGSNVPLVVTVHDIIQLVVPGLKGGQIGRAHV